jgi:hypothetical protein
MRAFSTRIACRAIASTPAAIRSGRNLRPPGWTRRCSARATIFSSRDEVYFRRMILMDSDSETALCLGGAYLVGDRHAEPLNAHDLDLAPKWG